VQKVEQETLLTDFFDLRSHSGDPELAIIEAALFVEQTFGVCLPDDQISAMTLGTSDTIRRLVLESGESR